MLAKPTKQQLEWAKQEVGVIIHYDIQVFQPISKSDQAAGIVPPVSAFNPTKLDTDQWLQTAKSAGAKYAVLVAKHCTGFSLWDTACHGFNVMESPYGKDIVAQFVASCKKFGIKPGIYYSLACNYLYQINSGRHADRQKQLEYYQMAQRQLRELWTNYGDLFEIWFDGGILPSAETGINLLDLYSELQPNAIKFQGSMLSATNNLRWAGNEDGHCPKDTLSTITFVGNSDGTGTTTPNPQGLVDGELWAPPECDTPNRKLQWFYEDNQDSLVLSATKLMDMYIHSVGHNGNFLIGMVINKDGLVPDKDVDTFKEFGTKVAKFNKNSKFSGHFNKSTTFEFDKKLKFNTIILEEDVTKGHSVYGYAVYIKKFGIMLKVHSAKVIGHKRIACIHTVSTTKIEVRITNTLQKVTDIKLSLLLNE